MGARAQSPTYKWIHGDNPLQDRDAYLLTLLEQNSSAAAALDKIPELQAIKRRLIAARATELESCEASLTCRVDSLVLTEPEIETTADILKQLAAPNSVLNGLVRDEMRPSGQFQKYAALSDQDFLRAAWLETARGVNRLYRLYGTEVFYSIGIDGPDYRPTNNEFPGMQMAALVAESDADDDKSFFSPWSKMGFDLLIANQRNEAARYEPLDTGANAAAFARSRSLEWKNWRYTAIVVGGIGLNTGETGLSATGAFLMRMAAKRWQLGLAPFIIVSGGNVHPNRTPYNEAVEMKHELMVRYSIPEDAIVIDPYARHTTTNIRNAVRLLFRMAAPMDGDFDYMVGIDTRYLEMPTFVNRFEHELGYTPFIRDGPIGRFDYGLRPVVTALHADMQDPLDP